MAEILATLDGLSPWWWVAIALVFAAAELITFSYFLLWLSLASLTVAGALWVMPGLSGAAQMGLWALSAIAYIVVGWKFFGKRKPGEPLGSLNNRAAALIGRHAVVADQFSGRAGPVEIDGIRWRARLADQAPVPEPGAEMIVTATEGMTLILSDGQESPT